MDSKGQKGKAQAFVAVLVVIAVGLTAISVAGDDSGDSGNDSDETPEESAYEYVADDEHLQEYERRIVDEIGEEERDESKIISIEQEHEGEIEVSFRATESLTENSTRRSMKRDMLDIFEVAPDDRTIIVEAELPLVDEYGNEEEAVVGRVSIVADDLEQINWDNFTRSNLEGVANTYWIHAAIQE